MLMQDRAQRHAMEFFTGNCAPKAEAHFVNIAVILPGGIPRPQMLAGVIENPAAGAAPAAAPFPKRLLPGHIFRIIGFPVYFHGYLIFSLPSTTDGCDALILVSSTYAFRF